MSRFLLVLGVSAALIAPAAPAYAATPPAPPTSASGTVGDRLMDLTWSGGAGTGALVRDVTGIASPYTPASGREVPVTSPTTARDTGFTNTVTQTYAVWTTEDDGTPSDAPLLADVAVAPVVPTSLTLAPTPEAVLTGRAVNVVGTLTRAGGAPVGGVEVELRSTVVGTDQTRVVRRVTTGSDGVARTTVVPSLSSTLQMRFAGDAFSAPADSEARLVKVLPRLTLGLTPPTIKKGETTVVNGRVTPTIGNAPVLVQLQSGSTWRTVANLRTASNGTYRWVTAPGLGTYTYRAVLLARPSYLEATAHAAVLRVEARDLVRGNTGPDVAALKRQLRALHYEPGAADGSFDYDLQHAVMAFQKVERLPVTGRWTKAERTRAGTPTAWRVRAPGVGRAVEVSVTRQVLVITEKGVVSKIIDVSTGTEKPYTYQGESDVAHTPRGKFSVYYKIDGVRVSKLGELYRPSYFYKGWAIHGSDSVPSYPASHGCVRVTDPNADRLFPLLTKGTPVTVYDE